MRRAGLWLVPIALILSGASAWAADDPGELERTWLAARVHLPGTTPGRALSLGDALGAAGEARRHPTVIYLHGCDGIDTISAKEGAMLAAAGYAVIMPDGFARHDKPKSCDVASRASGLHRAVLGWRQAEAMNAIEQARALPWVEADQLFLFGFSEGAITAATLGPSGVRARIVEGWTCHAGWPEYQGLNAPPAEPVLALVGAEDPWFRLPVLKGDCGPYLEPGNGSRSVVFEAEGPLGDKHYLSWHHAARGPILEFLEQHRSQASEATP